MPQQQQRQYPAANSGFLNDLDPNEGGRYQPYPEHDPRDTPRLYGQNAGQGQGQMPPAPPAGIPAGMGTRAKKTMPVGRRPITEHTQFQIRDKCWTCNGTGHVKVGQAACNHHRCNERTFSPEAWADHAAHDWRGDTLPCGHDRRKYAITVYAEVNCAACAPRTDADRIGYVDRWFTFEQHILYLLNSPMFMNAFFDVLEEIYPRIKDPATAEHRAVYTHQAAANAQYQRSEPTAPPVHIGATPLAPVAPLMPDEWEAEQIRNGRNKGSF